MQPLTRVLLLTIGLVLLGTPASAVVLSAGDIVIVSGVPDVKRMDPSTGATEVIATAGSCSALGVPNADIEAVSVESGGNVLVSISSFGTSTVVRVDPADGSCSSVGAAPNAFFVEDMAVTPTAPLVGASAISDWGIALVVGILLGLSFRVGRRSAARMA